MQLLIFFLGAVFLAGITGIFLISGFSSTLTVLKKNNSKLFNKCNTKSKNHNDTGTDLALKALGWGSFFSITGCSALCYSIWKLSGATSFEDFRIKIQNLLPKISKDDFSKKC